MNSTRRFIPAVVLFFVSAQLWAVLMRPLPIEELSQKADLVVHGIVQQKTSHRDAEGRIYTKIELQLSEVWKGAVSGDSLVIYQGGGTVGNERAEVSGEAEYGVGEEVVAFLVLNARRQPITLALAQGKFHVWRDKQSGEKLAHNVFHGMRESGGNAARPAPGAAAQKKAERLKLSDLKQKVQEAKP